jgi:hypothetical protein
MSEDVRKIKKLYLGIFFSCSLLTALTSLSVADSVNRGHRKNWLNLKKQAGLKIHVQFSVVDPDSH